jgi:hypothetical protein
MLNIGDKLYDWNLKEYVIDKIGTKYYYAGVIKIHKDSLLIASEYSSSQLSQDYDGLKDDKNRKEMWKILCRFTSGYFPPKEQTTTDLRKMCDLIPPCCIEDG